MCGKAEAPTGYRIVDTCPELNIKSLADKRVLYAWPQHEMWRLGRIAKPGEKGSKLTDEEQDVYNFVIKYSSRLSGVVADIAVCLREDQYGVEGGAKWVLVEKV